MTKPLNYQLECVDFIDAHGGRALIADDMGLGKTFESLLWFDENKSVRPAIVVCPAAVKYHWQAEALHHFGIRAEVLHGRKRPRRRKAFLKHPMLIINYEILAVWLPFLKRYKAQLLIIDEIHRVKNPQAQCSNAVRSLSYGIPHLLELGGSPMENKPSELWHPLHLLHPHRYRSYLPFSFRHCYAKLTPWGWQFRGAKNPEKLHRILVKRGMIRRLKKDVLKELPAKKRIVLPVEMSNKQEYIKALKNFRSWLANSAPTKASKMKRGHWKAEQMVKIGYLRRLAAQLKLPSVYDWINNFLEESDDKLIVFGIHRAIINEMQKKYRKSSVKVTGEITGEKRRRAIDTFINDPNTRLFIGNIHAAGVGVNGLQKVSNTVLTVEFDWKPTTHNQADDRAHRLGQKRSVFSYYLVAKGSVEEKLCAINQDKQDDINSVVDGGSRSKKRDFDIFDQLTEALRKESSFF